MKTVVITGGSSGIGAAMGVSYAKRGYRVALLARRADLLAQNVAAIRAVGGAAIDVVCDVTDRASVSAAVDRVRSEWGEIDVAIANAGVSGTIRLTDFSVEHAEVIMKTNVFGLFYLFDATVPRMIEQKRGHFAGVASLAGLRALPTSSVYSASKAAMQTFLECARIELAPRGVTISTINPGFVETPMTARHKFKMPFLMKADEAGEVIVKGMEAKKREINFPLPPTVIMKLARTLPNFIFDRAVVLSPKK